MHTIVITGGAGFIGNHVVRRFVQQYPDYHIICLDVLTYAGNLANLADVENAPNYEFARLDICDYAAVRRLFERNTSTASSTSPPKVTSIAPSKIRWPSPAPM